MRIDKIAVLFVLLGCMLPESTAVAGNAYEQGLEQALAGRIEQGEPVWLDATGDRFLAVYLQQLPEQPLGAAIIVHGMGGHPDWPQVVAPLRLRLPAAGWATLSIQMPVLEPGEALAGYGDTIKQAGNRIRTAENYLREQGYLTIVLIGYGFGATSGACYLAENSSDIQAFAGIGMQSYDFLSPRMDLDACLAQIDVPVLDLYGSRDFDAVLRQAANRRLEARNRNKAAYQQVSIEDADHYYTGLEDILARRLSDWLDQAVPATGGAVEPALEKQTVPDSQ